MFTESIANQHTYIEDVSNEENDAVEILNSDSESKDEEMWINISALQWKVEKDLQ